MKRISLIVLIITCILCRSFTQEPVEAPSNAEIQGTEADSTDNMKIVVGNDVIVVEDQDSLMDIRVGKRGLKILESLEDTLKTRVEIYRTEEAEEPDDEKVLVIEIEEECESDDEDVMVAEDENDEEFESKEGYYSYRDRKETRRYRSSKNFRGHWSGFEAGFNNYNYENSMNLPEAISYMSLDENNSINFNLNFSQLDIGFTRHFGIVTGLGMNWSNYRFEKRNSITIGADGNVSELIPGGSIPVKRSKFSILYLNVPAMLEVQIPAGYRNHLNLAAGVIGSLKLNAWTKTVYEDGEKSRTNGDYNLNLLRGGVTARIGYQNFMIYGTYFLTPWFRELQGPGGYNLEPFEIGLAFTIND
jgi:hypothetical protein